MYKKFLLVFSFIALFSISCFGAGMGDAFKDIYEDVIALFLNNGIVSLIFLGLFIGAFVALYKYGGLTGFIAGAVFIAIGFGYKKMDVLIEKAVGNAGAANGVLM
ncbi:hypothetical protein [Campylobacter sp. RM12651]|uniref:hypothetical protein n=1 Tax=Campylobacter sp. RM12651 TaxID=1660079 RepID=UPI001EFC12A4|nr:hypothetical protein [Campylobacter sp. RM12651]ULO03840.1 putative membrane protein [Campylobacter sp. RM12651]